ncbi:type II toxin-antitoxin system ParD family antitoxin [Nostoc sp. HG1]|jgi:antitoxin ParD1/3/4|nr:type II toxin-antitoxin system ParD family antitoxin [Nostoc sp. HG1]
MNVHLGETFDKFVAELIASGLYQSQSEVMREGLRLLKEREDIRKLRLEELRREVQLGIDQISRGEFTTYTNANELADEIKATGRRRQKKNPESCTKE